MRSGARFFLEVSNLANRVRDWTALRHPIGAVRAEPSANKYEAIRDQQVFRILHRRDDGPLLGMKGGSSLRAGCAECHSVLVPPKVREECQQGRPVHWDIYARNPFQRWTPRRPGTYVHRDGSVCVRGVIRLVVW